MKYGYARVSPGGKSESVEAQRRQLTKAGCRKVFRDVHVSGAAGSQPVDQERAILIARHDALDLALTIALAGYQCRIARATAVELSLNDYRPFELPLAIPGTGVTVNVLVLRLDHLGAIEEKPADRVSQFAG